jgi:O-antigen/teichoic acid export membrane protein
MPDTSDSVTDSPAPAPQRRVFQNALFSVLIKAQGAVFSYIITRLLLHAMQVEEYGLYSVLFTGVMVNLPLIARLAIPNLLIRFIPELFSQSRYRTIDRVFRAVNLIQIGVAVVLLMIAYIFAPELAVLIKFPGSESIIRIFSIGALAFLVQENVRIVLSGLFKQRTIFLVTFSYSCVRLASIFYVTQYAYLLTAVVAVEVGALLIGLFLFFVAYRRTIRPLTRQDPDRTRSIEWRRFTRYTGLSYLNEIGTMFMAAATDLFLVTGILGGLAVGFYGIATKITTMVREILPSQIMRWVIEPLFFSQYGSHRSSKAESVQFGYTLLMKGIVFVTLPTGIWLALMAEPVIVHLFEPGYAEAARIITIMALFLPINLLQMPLGLALQNAERIDLLIYSKVAGILKILAGLCLVPIGGVMAMVWISCIALSLQNVFLYTFIAAKLRIRSDLVGLLRLLVNGALTGLLFLQIRDLFTGVIGVLASVLCFGAIYLALNILHRTFRPKERAFINEHLPYPLWKF